MRFEELEPTQFDSCATNKGAILTLPCPQANHGRTEHVVPSAPARAADRSTPTETQITPARLRVPEGSSDRFTPEPAKRVRQEHSRMVRVMPAVPEDEMEVVPSFGQGGTDS